MKYNKSMSEQDLLKLYKKQVKEAEAGQAHNILYGRSGAGRKLIKEYGYNISKLKATLPATQAKAATFRASHLTKVQKSGTYYKPKYSQEEKEQLKQAHLEARKKKQNAAKAAKRKAERAEAKAQKLASPEYKQHKRDVKSAKNKQQYQTRKTKQQEIEKQAELEEAKKISEELHKKRSEAAKKAWEKRKAKAQTSEEIQKLEEIKKDYDAQAQPILEKIKNAKNEKEVEKYNQQLVEISQKIAGDIATFIPGFTEDDLFSTKKYNELLKYAEYYLSLKGVDTSTLISTDTEVILEIIKSTMNYNIDLRNEHINTSVDRKGLDKLGIQYANEVKKDVEAIQGMLFFKSSLKPETLKEIDKVVKEAYQVILSATIEGQWISWYNLASLMHILQAGELDTELNQNALVAQQYTSTTDEVVVDAYK